MYYISTNSDIDSRSHFTSGAQTDIITDATDYPTHILATIGVANDKWTIKQDYKMTLDKKNSAGHG